jgi:transglutaminase-like putative cysteine protease
MRISGTVDGNVLRPEGEGAAENVKPVRWDPNVIGLYRQKRIFKDKQVKPGDRFRYLSYEGQVNAVVGVQVTVGDEEEVTVVPGRPKQRLLRVEAVPDKIGGVQLPAMTGWLDKDYEMLRSEVDMPGLGHMVFYRTTKAIATDTPSGANLPEIQQLIRLNRRIPNAYETTAAVYRITLKGDDDVRKAFVLDDRQQVKNVRGRTFELHIHATRGPQPGGNAEKVGDEFLRSNFFINCDDTRVKALARRAVGTETDPWKKAVSIERWVRRNMRITNYTEAMATADHVAKTLEGDCTEFSMLAAAMCRAVGVPSRTAIGLVYTEDRRGPAMGFHMWTEVWVNGRWLPIDATLGRGYVGAEHLKVTDASWDGVRGLTPLVPLFRVMGKISIEVVRSEAGE